MQRGGLAGMTALTMGLGQEQAQKEPESPVKHQLVSPVEDPSGNEGNGGVKL